VHECCYRRHRHLEFIAFLQSLARRYPRPELRFICDNYGTHKHPAVTQWLAIHPRFHLHFTPTSASWLNMAERWFGLITSQAIRRDSFDSVASLGAGHHPLPRRLEPTRPILPLDQVRPAARCTYLRNTTLSRNKCFSGTYQVSSSIESRIGVHTRHLSIGILSASPFIVML